MTHDTIPQRLFDMARARPDVPAFFHKVDGRYEPTRWGEYATLVRRAGKALLALGLKPEDTVSILGFNRPEWVIFHVAAMAVGAVPVGLYTTSSAEEVQYIVQHAGSKVVLLENMHPWEKVQRELPRLPLLQQVVMMRGAAPADHPLVVGWDDFLTKGDEIADERFFERLNALEPGGLATLIYTSGTTGPPKGVMLSHTNLAWTAMCVKHLARATEKDVALSYLPLSHIAEQLFSIHGHITVGHSLYFAESIEKMPDNLKEVSPTLFFGVPRIWEKLHAGISRKLADAPAAKRLLVEAAMRIGAAYNGVKNEGRMPSPFLELAHVVADKLVFSKLKPAVGLGRARFCVSGAAPIAPAVLEFFLGLDLVIFEVYGQSEGAGPTSVTRFGNVRLGTVGPPIPGVAVHIAEDGEILVKGPNVFLGYYKDPQASAETLQDGMLRSGDLGKLDDAQNLVITGRKKEIIITAGGKNITPKNIEAALKEHALIAEAVVVGDRRKYLTVLLVLNPEEVQRFVPSPDAVHAALQRIVDEVNARLSRVETIKKFTVVPKPFSIDAGELTPTLKVKRKVVYEKHAAAIEAMYAGDAD